MTPEELFMKVKRDGENEARRQRQQAENQRQAAVSRDRQRVDEALAAQNQSGWWSATAIPAEPEPLSEMALKRVVRDVTVECFRQHRELTVRYQVLGACLFFLAVVLVAFVR